jgi:TolA-binding protein
MLKPQKKRITKKNLKEDKFVETTLLARSYIEEHSKELTYIVAGVLVVGLLIWLFLNHRAQRLEQASVLLGKAQTEIQSMHTAKAREFLNQLVQEYDGTDAADKGYFLLANLDYQAQKYNLAEQEYKKFIDSYSGSKILLASAYAGYAACLEHRGAHAEAAKNYLKAQETAPEFVDAPNYLYLAGLNYKDAGMKDKAKEVFQKLIKKYKDSKRVNDAKTQLILLEK